MTELDAFEVRLAAAIHGYIGRVSSDLDPVELARRIAAAEPRGGGFAPTPAWSRVAVPRVAWVLLLAMLLIAMVGGMLLAGSQGERKLATLLPPVGQVFECPPGSTPDKPGPVDQARPVGEPYAMAFDRRAGRLVAVVQSQWATHIDETWTFDVCTNAWTQMHPNRDPNSFGRGRLVYDIDSDVTILFSEGTVWAYDLEADTWTEKKSAAPAGDALYLPRDALYDPVSGRVVAADGRFPNLRAYDVESDTWTPIHELSGPWGNGAYNASVDRVIVYGGGDLGPETWLVDLHTWRWSKSGAETPTIMAGWEGMGAPNLVYDEAAERTVAIGWQVEAYDAIAERWEVVFGGSGGRPDWVSDSVVYDPVNRRLVGWYQGGDLADRGGVVALDLTTRRWTVLLEPGTATP